MKLFLILFLSIPLLGQDRLSSFSLNYSDDQEEYKAYQFNANWGVNEKLQLGISLFRADIAEDESREVSLSARYFLTDYFDANAFVSRRNEPNELESRSFGFGGVLELSKLWDGYYRTFITASATRSDYEQDQTSSGTFTTIQFQRSFVQGEYFIELEQEITSWLTVAANYTTYVYQDDSLISSTSSFNQLNFNTGFNGVADYPDSRVGGVVILSPSLYFDLEIFYNDTRSNVESLDSSDLRTLLTIYATDKLSLNFGHTETSLESAENIDTYEVGFGYFF